MIRLDMADETADETQVNLAALKTISPAPGSLRERETRTWVATFLDGSTHQFEATGRRIHDLMAQLIPAPLGYAVVTVMKDKVLSEPVVAFGIHPGYDYPPIPYTTGGMRQPVGATQGLLDPTGQVTAGTPDRERYPDLDSFLKVAFEVIERERVEQ